MAGMDYSSVFNAPMAAYYGLQDRDRAIASGKIADQQAQENVRAKQLSNLFDEQNNPQKIAEQNLINEGRVLANTNQGYINRQNSVKADISDKTADLQYSAEQRKLISEASKADMDDLQYRAQMAAQNPLSTPQQREEGIKALKMHSDFLKIQEQYKNDMAKQSNAQAFSREQQNRSFAHADRQAATRSANTAQTSTNLGKMSMDQRRSYFVNQMANAKSDDEYAQAAAMVDYITSQMGMVRTDPGIGKTVIQDGALTPVPPRSPVLPPPRGGRAAIPQQQIPSIQDVMRMYPGKSEADLRAAMKKKYGDSFK